MPGPWPVGPRPRSARLARRPPRPAIPTGEYRAAVGASFGRAQADLVGPFGSTSDDIAKVIIQAVTARRPRARYLINPVAKSLVAMNRVLPARVCDSVLRRQYGLPG
jgi:hypothetical protein